jgi:hypothetical protein
MEKNASEAVFIFKKYLDIGTHYRYIQEPYGDDYDRDCILCFF